MPLPPNTLNQALDQLPQLLLTLGKLQQDRRDEELRRDIQQASQSFQAEMLTKRIAAEKELTEFKAGLEVPKDPPEVAILGRRIEKDLDILRDPNTALTLNESEINAVKNRVSSNLAEHRSLSGRDYPVDPSLIEPAPITKPPPVAALPPPGEAIRPRGGREIRPRLVAPEGEAPFSEEIAAKRAGIEALAPPSGVTPVFTPAAEEIPAGFPDPSGFPENQTATFNGEPWIIRNGQWVKGT